MAALRQAIETGAALHPATVPGENPPAPKVPRRIFRARVIPQVPQVLIALARGGGIFALESCVFDVFGTGLKCWKINLR